jgi:hypothetical protein
VNRNRIRIPWLAAIILALAVDASAAWKEKVLYSFKLGFLSSLFLFTVTFLCTGMTAATWKEQVLYSFQGGKDGSVPVGALALDKAGNLYGGTVYGGSISVCNAGWCGTAYQLSPGQNGWTETILHVFQGKPAQDGGAPNGGVIIDALGNVYGVTAYGGAGNCILLGSNVGCGTVYQLHPPSGPGGTWTESVIYSFQGGKDGFYPQGDLVFDKSGNLFGATGFGGGGGRSSCDAFYNGCGTIFELSPPRRKGGKWMETILYRFQNKKDGGYPNGGLAFDNGGVIYGTTYCGGQAACENLNGGSGTVFGLKPGGRQKTWKFEVLYTFRGDPDGADPAAGVVLGLTGVLYGTTKFGGKDQSHAGTIFQLSPPTKKRANWTEQLLFSCTGFLSCAEPQASMLLDKARRLYGMSIGGQTYAGQVFEIDAPVGEHTEWRFDRLYNFAGPPDGAHPLSRLIRDSAGKMYSNTQYGGTGTSCQGGCGTVFELAP